MNMLKKCARLLFLIVGAALVVNGLLLAPVIAFNLGVVAVIFMGASLLSYGVGFHWINKKMGKGILKVIRYAGYLFLIFMMSVILFIAAFGQVDTVDYTEDAIIVLGAGIRGEQITAVLKYRLDSAYAYWMQNPQALVVVAGGQGPGESITEAEAMRRYLVSRGVPENCIVKEDRSTSTHENFSFSKMILDERLEEGYKIAFATNAFHIYRGYHMANNVGLTPAHIHAKIQWYMIPTNYLREFLAVMALWVFGN